MRKSIKLIVVAGALAALAVPSAAMAAPGYTGVSSNGNTKDVVGYAVSAGNYNYHQAGETTGQNRKEINATSGPGAVADVIHSVQAMGADYDFGPYAPPSQP